jgi:hypothetical protein
MSNLEYWFRYKALDRLPEILLFTAIVSIIFGLYPAMKFMNTYECEQYEKITGRETKMVDLNCYTKYNGEWYRFGEVKISWKSK